LAGIAQEEPASRSATALVYLNDVPAGDASRRPATTGAPGW
jgi:hypothetical protein